MPQTMPVQYSIEYHEHVDPFKSSSSKKLKKYNLTSDTLLTVEEIATKVYQKFGRNNPFDIQLISQDSCVEYDKFLDDRMIFHEGKL